MELGSTAAHAVLVQLHSGPSYAPEHTHSPVPELPSSHVPWPLHMPMKLGGVVVKLLDGHCLSHDAPPYEGSHTHVRFTVTPLMHR